MCVVCECVYGVCVCMGVYFFCVFVCGVCVVCVCVWLSMCLWFVCVRGCVVRGLTQLGEACLATSWPTTWVQLDILCFPMTNNADLLVSAVTLADKFTSIWITVENIVEASYEIIKVVPKNEKSLQLHMSVSLMK